jgi:hypothetical protein
MLSIHPSAAAVVAEDTKASLAAVDHALLNSARLCTSLLEAAQGTPVPARHSQKILASMAKGFSHVVEGRAAIVDTITHLHALRERSDMSEQDFGCPAGWPAGNQNQFEPTGTMVSEE